MKKYNVSDSVENRSLCRFIQTFRIVKSFQRLRAVYMCDFRRDGGLESDGKLKMGSILDIDLKE
jgi:hypothetical protein